MSGRRYQKTGMWELQEEERNLVLAMSQSLQLLLLHAATGATPAELQVTRHDLNKAQIDFENRFYPA